MLRLSILLRRNSACHPLIARAVSTLRTPNASVNVRDIVTSDDNEVLYRRLDSGLADLPLSATSQLLYEVTKSSKLSLRSSDIKSIAKNISCSEEIVEWESLSHCLSVLQQYGSRAGRGSDVNVILSAFSSMLLRFKGSIDAGFFLSNILLAVKSLRGNYPKSRQLLNSCCHMLQSPAVVHLSPRFTVDETCNILSGMSRLSSSHEEVQSLMRIVNGSIKDLPSSDFTSRVFYHALAACKNKMIEVDEVSTFLTVLTDKLKDSEHVCVDPRSIGFAMTHLRHLTQSDNSVHAFWEVMAAKFSDNNLLRLNQFPKVPSIINRLKSISSPEVKYLLPVLTERLLEVTKVFKSNNSSMNFSLEHVSLVLQGLQRLSSKQKPVRQLLAALSLHVETCTIPLAEIPAAESSKLYTAISGIRHLSSRHTPVVDFLDAVFTVAKKVPLKADALSNEDFSTLVGGSLGGFRNMNVKDSREVIVPFLNHLILMYSSAASKHDLCLSPTAIFNSLVGVYHMSDDVKTQVLHFLNNNMELQWKKEKECNTAYMDQWNPSHISMTLKSISSLSSECKEIRRLLRNVTLIMGHVRNMNGLSRSGSNNQMKNQKNKENMVWSVECLSDAYTGLGGFSCKWEEVRGLVSALSMATDSNRRESFTTSVVANMLFELRFMSTHSAEVRQLITVLTDKVIACKDQFTTVSIYRTLYGLQNMDSDFEEIRALIAAVTTKIQYSLGISSFSNSVGTFTAWQVKYALLGLQNMSNHSAEMKHFLTVFTSKLKQPQHTSLTIPSDSLYGLQRMNNITHEMCHLLTVLTPMMAAHTDVLSPHLIGRTLYGIRSMTEFEPGLTGVLRMLKDKIAATSAECENKGWVWDGNSIYSSFTGFQNLSNTHVFVDNLLFDLCDAIKMNEEKRCTGESAGRVKEMTAFEVSWSFYSLKRMLETKKDGKPLVGSQSAFELLSRRLLRIDRKNAFSSHNISKLLFGLQLLSAESPVVKPLLTSLVPKVKHCQGFFTNMDMGDCLYGLQGMSTKSEETRALVGVLADKFKESNSVITGNNARVLTNCIVGLHSMSPVYAEVRSMLSVITARFQMVQATESASAVATTGASQPSAQMLQHSNFPPKPWLHGLTKVPPLKQPGTRRSAPVGMSFFSPSNESIDVSRAVPLYRNKLLVDPFLKISRSDLPKNTARLRSRGDVEYMSDVDKLEVPVVITGTDSAVEISTTQNIQKELNRKIEVKRKLLGQSPSESVRLSSALVCSIMKGLRGMTAQYPEVIQLVRFLIPRIEECTGSFSPKQLEQMLRQATLLCVSARDETALKVVSKLVAVLKEKTKANNSARQRRM